MQLTLTFDPQVDEFDEVLTVVANAFGEDHEFILTAISTALNQHYGSEQVAATVVEPVAATVVEPDTAAPAINQALEIDIDGVPWDARIHSDAAERLSSVGRWKKRRNLPDGFYEEITNELKLLASAAVGTEALPIQTLSAPDAPPLLTPAPLKSPEIVEVAPDTFVTEASQAPHDHVTLMQWVAANLASKKLTKADVDTVLAAGQLPNLMALEHMSAEWITWAHASLLAALK